MLCSVACLMSSAASREKLDWSSCRRCGAIAAVGIFGIAGIANGNWALPLLLLPPPMPGKPANPGKLGKPPSAANGLADAGPGDSTCPGLAWAASFCHWAGSATARHVLSHCSNIFCTVAGSAAGIPKGAAGAPGVALASDGRDEPGDDEDEDLEAAISAFDLSVPRD